MTAPILPPSSRTLTRRTLVGASLGAAAVGSLPRVALAQDVLAGRYDTIQPAQPVADPAKVEVLEVFSFACPHCWRFMPVMGNYEKNAPDYVTVKRMPAIFRESWIPLAQAFYTSQVLGMEHEMRGPIFEAVHVKKERLNGQDAIRDVFVRNGADAKKFDKAYNSFTVRSRLKDGANRQRQYGVNATPTVIVHGQYRVTTTRAGGFEGVIEVIQGLSGRLKSELKAA